MRYFSQSFKHVERELCLLVKRKKKKKIFIFISAARFIVSEVVTKRNYLDISTYAFCKKMVITAELDSWKYL
jgi:hypothetical protein